MCADVSPIQTTVESVGVFRIQFSLWTPCLGCFHRFGPKKGVKVNFKGDDFLQIANRLPAS